MIIFCNRTARIRHQCRKTAVSSCHRCLINTGVKKMSHICTVLKSNHCTHLLLKICHQPNITRKNVIRANVFIVNVMLQEQMTLIKYHKIKCCGWKYRTTILHIICVHERNYCTHLQREKVSFKILLGKMSLEQMSLQYM